MLDRRKVQFFSIMSAVFIGLALFNFARSSAASGPSTITVAVVSDGNGPFAFSFGGDSFSLAGGETFVKVPYATGYEQIYQTELPGYTLTRECTGAAFDTLGNNGVGVNYTDGDEVVCTFTNTLVAGSFTIINETNGTDSFDFEYGSQTYSLASGEQFTQTGLNPGSYDVYQDTLQGYDLSISCVGGSTEALGSNGIRMLVGEQEDIVCTFNNENVAGSFEIQATSDTTTTFGFVIGGESFSLSSGQAYSQTNLFPGDFDVFQTEMPGYILSISCEGGATEAQGMNGIRMMVASGEHIVCTFDNDYVGSTVTINNVISPSASINIDYVGQFGEFALANGGSQTTTDVLPGVYTYYANVPAGYAIEMSCTGTTAAPSGDNGLELTIAAEEEIACTTVLTYVAGSVTINTASDVVSETDFTYATSFGDFAQNAGGININSELMPGTYLIYQNEMEGFDLTSIECVGADTELLGSNGINVILDAREDAVCTFTNQENDTNAPVEPVNLLVNADFEAGRDGTWREQSDYGFNLVVHESAYGGTVAPQSGEHLAWLGGARYEDSYISQEVELPAGESASVGFSYWIQSRDWCGYDWGAVYVYDIEANDFSRVWAHTLCRGTRTYGWADAEVDLSDYAGKTVRVVFYGGNDAVYRSSMYVDDVEIMTVAPTGRSASTDLDIVGADPKSVGTGETAEVIDSDLDAVAAEVEKPARVENSRAALEDNISNKAPSAPTAVSLSSSNAAFENSMSILMVSILTMVLSGTTVFIAARRRNGFED